MTDSIIFDLDGTLWDASESSARGWNTAFEKLGYPERIIADDIRRVSGRPFKECIATLCWNASDDDLNVLFSAIRHEENKAVSNFGGRLYPGVAGGIAALEGSYRMFIVSNCQEWYLRSFLEHSALSNSFEGWECHGGTGRPKHENIVRVVKQHSLTAPVYIGDTEGDQSASKRAGVDFLHASYGFGRVNGATHLSTFHELVLYLQSRNPKRKQTI